MKRFTVVLAAVLFLGAAYGLAHWVLIEVGREVIVLRTQQDDGAWLESRLWIVEEGGVSWLHGAGSRWMRNLKARPVVEVERAGERRRYRAQVVPGPHPRLHDLLRAKYGVADRWVRFVGPDNAATTAVRLDPLEGPGTPSRAEPASQRELLDAARATLASQIEPGLPHAPIDAWLAVLVGPRASLAWSLDDCGEQTGAPEVDASRELPVCAGLEARLPDGRTVSLGFLVGSEARGVTEERGLYFAGVVGSDGPKSFRTLSALAHHLREEAR